jgi:hypothetical protein
MRLIVTITYADEVRRAKSRFSRPVILRVFPHNRREADITDRGLGRLNWADSGRSRMNPVRVANKRMPWNRPDIPSGWVMRRPPEWAHANSAALAREKRYPKRKASGDEGVTVTRCQDFQHVSRSLPSRLRSRTVPDQVRTNFRPRNTSSDIELTVAPMWVATMPLIVAAHAAHRGKAGGKMLSVDNGTRPCEQSGKWGWGSGAQESPRLAFIQ